jgi:hypothetical protein
MATILLTAVTASAWLMLCHWISDLIWGGPPVRGAAVGTPPPAPGPSPDRGGAAPSVGGQP